MALEGNVLAVRFIGIPAQRESEDYQFDYGVPGIEDQVVTAREVGKAPLRSILIYEAVGRRTWTELAASYDERAAPAISALQVKLGLNS
jgi:hypothetical protein